MSSGSRAWPIHQSKWRIPFSLGTLLVYSLAIWVRYEIGTGKVALSGSPLAHMFAIGADLTIELMTLTAYLGLTCTVLNLSRRLLRFRAHLTSPHAFVRVGVQSARAAATLVIYWFGLIAVFRLVLLTPWITTISVAMLMQSPLWRISEFSYDVYGWWLANSPDRGRRFSWWLNVPARSLRALHGAINLDRSPFPPIHKS